MRIKIPIGVTIRKKIVNIVKCEIIFPKKIPNLNHKIFKGFKILELNNPKIKNITEMKKN